MGFQPRRRVPANTHVDSRAEIMKAAGRSSSNSSPAEIDLKNLTSWFYRD
jgi:hypothetical protein